MLDLIEWLEGVERQAAELYGLAAEQFAEDEVLAPFFRQMAEEELWHLQLLESGLGREGKETLESLPLVTVDEETRGNIDALFAEARQRLATDGMARDAWLELVVSVEFTEWNEIFLYVLNLIRGAGREYALAVMEIDRHRSGIEHFFKTLPDGGRFIEAIHRLPGGAGEKKILLIEKEQAVARLLQSVLASVGETSIALSGEEGLLQMEREEFDVILSDITVLNMDSLEFYERAMSHAPQLKDRFIFFAAGKQGSETGEGELTQLSRPALVSHLLRVVNGVAHSDRVFH
ncbi:MAG: hypothetical protein C0621_01210 [Desulfuromonas sp.]|nr:MAG: hypothetical protein C0621_01210 [Desulfuromonas sp.]